LFPIPQRAYWNRVAIGEFFLGQAYRMAERLHPRDSPQPFSPFRRYRRILGIGCRGRLDFSFGPRWNRSRENRFFPAFFVDAHEGTVSAESDCSSFLAHASLICGRR